VFKTITFTPKGGQSRVCIRYSAIDGMVETDESIGAPYIMLGGRELLLDRSDYCRIFDLWWNWLHERTQDEFPGC